MTEEWPTPRDVQTWNDAVRFCQDTVLFMNLDREVKRRIIDALQRAEVASLARSY
jgi:hypothetical protein